jgi:hypothetical protein
MHSQLEARLVLALVGLVLASVGLVLVTNFRGFTAWHARKTFEFMKWADKPASRVPPWSWLADSPLEQRVARQVMLERVIGAMFAAAGVLTVVVSIVSSP